MKYLYTDVDIPESAGYKPNMNRLRIIQKTELRWGEKLGEGAFGVVQNGLFVPEKDSVKVPVAIKSLTRIKPGSQQELLDEAELMGSINHPHLVRLVGVCVSQEIYLVTPLMPLGNLREYMKNNKNRVSSHSLLKWAGQIASGMEHLESEHLVHRDLAARNVLVRNPTHVAITDFGLAKLIPYGKEGVHVEGRVPVKWLAPECMESHSFTSKSDVWAYGVTIWEMLTFGQHPYGNTGAHQLLKLLRDGLRLEQPDTCSIELYMILIKCWLLEAESRPTFSELTERMGEMLKSPASYVIIKNDHLLRLPSTNEEWRVGDPVFRDEANLMDPLAYFDSANFTDDTLDTPLTSPTSPCKPLLLSQPPNRRRGPVSRTSTMSNPSERYRDDPVNQLPTHPEDTEVLPTDADNYLTPNSLLPSSSSSPSNQEYTRVLQGGKPVYYNDAAAGQGEGEVAVAVENLEYLAPNSRTQSVPESETTV